MDTYQVSKLAHKLCHDYILIELNICLKIEIEK